MEGNTVRIGRFGISNVIIRDLRDVALKILSGLIVVRAEALIYKDEIDYVAIGECFDEIEEYSEPPRYNAILTEQADGTLLVKFHRASA